MSEFIKRQDAINAVMQNYCYESDRLTALQELPVMDIPGAEERQNTHIVIKNKDALKYLSETEYQSLKTMKCRECKWLYTNESMDGLYICVNGKSDNFGEYTGICCEDDCNDGEKDYDFLESH